MYTEREREREREVWMYMSVLNNRQNFNARSENQCECERDTPKQIRQKTTTTTRNRKRNGKKWLSEPVTVTGHLDFRMTFFFFLYYYKFNGDAFFDICQPQKCAYNERQKERESFLYNRKQPHWRWRAAAKAKRFDNDTKKLQRNAQQKNTTDL